MNKKRKYGHKSLYQNTLIAIYNYISKSRKESYSSYETWAGRALISRTIASRVSKSYKKTDEVPDISLSTLLHMGQSLNIDLGKMFTEIQSELEDKSSEYEAYINDEENLRD